MKQNNTKILTYFSLLFILFLLPTLANAQDGFGEVIEDVPVDGGLSLLVAAGIGYGAKKMRKKPEETNK